MSKIDSNKISEWVNDITAITNSMTKGEMFSAGFELCKLQQEMIQADRPLEEQEKETPPDSNIPSLEEKKWEDFTENEKIAFINTRALRNEKLFGAEYAAHHAEWLRTILDRQIEIEKLYKKS